MDGHERDRTPVVGSGVEVGAQAYPFDEIGERIAAQHAHGLGTLRIAGRRCRELGIFVFVGLRELVDDAQKLLDVLDAAARLVGSLHLISRDDTRLVDDHLHHFAQIALV